jgi:hypothetical protein
MERARSLVDRRPLVYISAQQPLEQLSNLLASLRAQGLRPLWTDEFRSYLRIEDEIDRSDAVVAVIGSASPGSTWQMSELSFSCGGSGATSRVGTRLRPVFILRVADVDFALDWLQRMPSPPVYLEPDPDTAAALVAAMLRGQPS